MAKKMGKPETAAKQKSIEMPSGAQRIVDAYAEKIQRLKAGIRSTEVINLSTPLAFANFYPKAFRWWCEGLPQQVFARMKWRNIETVDDKSPGSSTCRIDSRLVLVGSLPPQHLKFRLMPNTCEANWTDAEIYAAAVDQTVFQCKPHFAGRYPYALATIRIHDGYPVLGAGVIDPVVLAAEWEYFDKKENAFRPCVRLVEVPETDDSRVDEGVIAANNLRIQNAILELEEQRERELEQFRAGSHPLCQIPETGIDALDPRD